MGQRLKTNADGSDRGEGVAGANAPPEDRVDIRLPDRLLRLRDVVDLTSLSRPTIYRAISEGRFPRPVKVGFASRWSAQEIADHVERLKAARFEKAGRS